jgi:prenyltransferase beta subunit
MTRQVRTNLLLLLHSPSFARARPHPLLNSTFIKKGAFGAHPGHDAHILSTLSAIQVLATHDALSRVNRPRLVDCTSPPRLLYMLDFTDV